MTTPTQSTDDDSNGDDRDESGHLEFIPPPADERDPSLRGLDSSNSDPNSQMANGADAARGNKNPKSHADAGRQFHEGDVVSPADRDNIGTVVLANEHSVLVRFVNRESGDAADRYFACAELRLIRRGIGDKPAIRIFSFSEMLDLRAPPYIIDGVLRQRDLAVLFGDPGSGKSFVGLDLVLSIATLPSWRGKAVFAGPILYIAAEGIFGLRSRALVWQSLFAPESFEQLEKFVSFIGAAVQLADEEEFMRLIAVLEKLDPRPSMIVVDTLSRCAAGADENSVRDMGAIILRLDRIRERIGCAILLIHHSAKDQKKERGSSAIRGAADVMLRLTVETKGNPRAGRPARLVLSCEKSKDEAPFDPIRLILQSREAVDETTGELLRSCVLECEDEGAGSLPSRALPGVEQSIVDVLYAGFRDRPASKTEIRDATSGRVKKSSLYAGLTSLQERGLLEVVTVGGVEKLKLTELGLECVRRSGSANGPDGLKGNSPDSERPGVSADRVQSRVRPPPKGGVDGSGLDSGGTSGPVQASSPVQRSPDDSFRTSPSTADSERVTPTEPRDPVQGDAREGADAAEGSNPA